MDSKRKYEEYTNSMMSNEPVQRVRKSVYTLYSIIPYKNGENKATYKQLSKYSSEEELSYFVNQLIKKKYDADKQECITQLSYFEEAEDENSFRRTDLKRIIESTFVPICSEEIMRLYKNNDLLSYSDERLYDYMYSISDFFVTISYTC